MNNGFTFNGVKKPYVTTVKKERPVFAPLKRNLLYIPGMAGAYLESTNTEVRIQPVTVWVDSEGFPSLQKLKEDMAAWLVTDQVAELVFDDELDRIYYAAVDGTFNLEELVSVGQGVINFICPAPYKYGSEKIAEFTSAASFIVEGTAETDPIITVQVKEDTTYLAVSDGEKLNLVGNPTKAGETPYDPETTILEHGGDNLTGWTNSSAASIESAEQAGVLKTNGSGFYTDDYGVGFGWHGPAMKTSLSQALQDFRFDVGLGQYLDGPNQAGGIEVALLDANSRIVAKISLIKHFGGTNILYGRIRAGTMANGQDIISENQFYYPNNWNGVFRVWRRGNEWIGQIFRRENGVFVVPVTSRWVDTNGVYSAPVAQVQVRLIQRADFPLVHQYVDDIKVYRLNDTVGDQVPIIGRAGDIFEFDHQNDIIRRNGEDITKEKAFIGEYFELKPGGNTITAEPMEAVENVEVRWRDRWR